MKVKDINYDRRFTAYFDRTPFNVFITDKRENLAVGSEAEAIIPKGYRLITPNEAIVLWSRNCNFREYFYTNPAVWTSQNGLDVVEGAYKILGDGLDDVRLEKITLEEYSSLGFIPEKRAWQYSGKQLVAVGGGYVGNRRLTLFGCVAEGLKLGAAYTRDLSKLKRN